MAERRVLKMGDARLQRVAEPVTELDSPALHALVQDLWDTMVARRGAGLAAPQIGVALRVVVFAVQDNPRYPDAEPVPRTVLVNPVLTPLDAELDFDWEGCLSVPGMRGLVPRHRRLGYCGTDAEGRPIEREVSGFHARVVQHECDHLDCILYPQRMTDLGQFGFEDELSLSGRYGVRSC